LESLEAGVGQCRRYGHELRCTYDIAVRHVEGDVVVFLPKRLLDGCFGWDVNGCRHLPFASAITNDSHQMPYSTWKNIKFAGVILPGAERRRLSTLIASGRVSFHNLSSDGRDDSAWADRDIPKPEKPP